MGFEEGGGVDQRTYLGQGGLGRGGQHVVVRGLAEVEGDALVDGLVGLGEDGGGQEGQDRGGRGHREEEAVGLHG